MASRDIIMFDVLDKVTALIGADAINAAAEVFTFPGGVIESQYSIPIPGPSPMPIGIAVTSRIRR